jgi:hypothetical protein
MAHRAVMRKSWVKTQPTAVPDRSALTDAKTFNRVECELRDSADIDPRFHHRGSIFT